MGTSKGYLPPTGYMWPETKRAVTNMAKNNFSGNSIGRAVSNFAKATKNNGFARGKKSSVGSVGSKAVGFIGLVRTIGLENALHEVGLSHLVGKSLQEIYFGLLDYFSEEANTLNQVIANQAMQELMAEIMVGVSEVEAFEQILSSLDGNIFLRDFLIKFVEVAFFTNFAEKINSLCKGIEETIKAQEQIKEFIRIQISNNYTIEDLKDIDWKGKSGKDFVEKKCEEVWEIFESWRDSNE